MIVHFQWQQLMKLPNPQITQRCFAIGTADKSGFEKIKGKQTIKQLKKKKKKYLTVLSCSCVKCLHTTEG